MKVLASLFLFAGIGVVGQAQVPTAAREPSDAVVIKFSWAKERLPGWEKNPFGPSVETYEDMRVRVARERQLQDAKNSGKMADAARIERDIQTRENATKNKKVTETRTRDGYRYKVTIRNTGSRTIRSVDWDYVFLDPTSMNEIARHQFTSDEKISAGKEKELSVLYLEPPISTVSAVALSQNKGYEEHVVIASIKYSDGSIWTRP